MAESDTNSADSVFDPADERLIEILVSGVSIPEAVQLSGASRRTVYRRLHDDRFRGEVAKRIRRNFHALTRRAVQEMMRRLNSLLEVFDDPDATYTEKATNYRILMDLADRGAQFEITDRLDDIGFSQ